MKSKTEEKSKKAKSDKEFSEEELKLKARTLKKTAPDTGKPTKSLSPVEALDEGGMESIGKETRVKPPSGKNIDREALELRDKTLARTAPDVDPKKKRIAQVTATGRGEKKKS